MPYSGPMDESLPDHVKKMSSEMKSQWVAVFNSAMKDGKTEGEAMKLANGVAKKQDKGLIWDLYSIDARQVQQDSVAYNPLGASGEKGCANCNWFVPMDVGCLNVTGDIVPTGLCNLWMSKPEYKPEPIPVVIVDGKSKGLIEQIISAAKSLLGSGEKTLSGSSPVPLSVRSKPRSIVFYKSEDGTTRFFAIVSNCYQDNQDEIITTAAHKEHVSYMTSSEKYPELWMWHSKGSKYGQVDWVDFVDGFWVASGIIDSDKEYLVKALENESIGMSHGFFGLSFVDSKQIDKVRSFEISTLPMFAVANIGTGFNALKLKEGTEMGFSDIKRKWLIEKAGVSEDKVKEWETATEELGSHLKELGLQFKEAEVGENDIKTLASEVSSLANSMKEITGAVVAIKQKQDELGTSLDKKVNDIFTAEIAKLPKGFKASESGNNIVNDGVVLKKDADWFGEIVKAAIK